MTSPDSRLPRVGRRLLAATVYLTLAVLFVGVLSILPLLLLGVVDVEATIQGWIRPRPAALGLEISLNEPERGDLTVTNVATSPARGLRIRIVEDYTYVDRGSFESESLLGELAPGDQRVVGFGANPAMGEIDIGALRVWLTCDRGTAFDFYTWSYAY